MEAWRLRGFSKRASVLEYAVELTLYSGFREVKLVGGLLFLFRILAALRSIELALILDAGHSTIPLRSIWTEILLLAS